MSSAATAGSTSFDSGTPFQDDFSQHLDQTFHARILTGGVKGFCGNFKDGGIFESRFRENLPIVLESLLQFIGIHRVYLVHGEE